MTIHDNQAQSAQTPGGEQGKFDAAVTRDPYLDADVITLSYTDAIDPNHNLAISIAPTLGSNLFSYQVGEYNLIYCDREELKSKQFTGNFVLWPFPNRVRDKKYTYQGKQYSLQSVPRSPSDPMLVHGLVYDRIWQFQQPVIKQDQVQVTTYVDMAPEYPYYDAYPFDSRLSLTYTLSSTGVDITYTVENKGQQSLPFGFALHPYFLLLSGKDDTIVSIPAHSVMEADETLLPTGRIFDVAKVMYAMYDLRTPQPVSTLRLDHVYTDLDTEAAAVIMYRKQQMRLLVKATTDFTHLVIFTLTNGAPYFCLENQSCATDAINLHTRGLDDIGHLLEVQPGESKSGTISYIVAFDTTL